MAEGAQLSKEQTAELATRGWRSPSEFCRVFLPAWFPSKMPWFHRGICALRTGKLDFLLDFGPEWWPEDQAAGVASNWTTADLAKIVSNFVIIDKEAVIRDGKIVEPEVTVPLFHLDYDEDTGAINGIHFTEHYNPMLIAEMVPRGFSKTTLANALNLRDCVYKEEEFIVYVSETAPHAERQLSTVRTQLEDNDLLKAVFGDLVPSRQSSRKWTDSLIEPTNGTRLGAIGSGGQIRGLAKDAMRPTRITIDDFQDKDTVRSETQRQKDIEWFVATLLPARKLFGSNQTKVDMIGTLLHPEAVMALILKDREWTRVRFGALDRQKEPLWAYAVDHEKLAKIREQFARLGQLDAFDYEYMSSVPMSDGVIFPLEKIIHINRPDEWFVGKALVVDPAISENPKADFCAFAVVGIGKFGKIHIEDIYAEVGMEFDAQAEKYFELHFAHMTGLSPDQAKHGVEAIAYQRALMSLILSKQHDKSKIWGNRAYFEVTPIKHGKTGKIMRVQGLLSPRVKAGHVSAARIFPDLEYQLRNWGDSTVKKDVPDVVAMAVQLLDPFASLARTDNPDESPGRDKLPPLAQVLGGRTFRKAP